LRILARREDKAVTQAPGKPDGPVRGGDKAEEQDKKDVPIWLQVTVGVLAILAFLGIANYHQLATALGLQKTPATSPRPSPYPSISPMAKDTGPADPQDAGTCTSALSDIQTLEFHVPPYSYIAESQFYRDESTTFGSLGEAATTLALKEDLGEIQAGTLALAYDYGYEASDDPADAPGTLSQLKGCESATESFCSQDAGITG
jgi:hypothetical protein